MARDWAINNNGQGNILKKELIKVDFEGIFTNTYEVRPKANTTIVSVLNLEPNKGNMFNIYADDCLIGDELIFLISSITSDAQYNLIFEGDIIESQIDSEKPNFVKFIFDGIRFVGDKELEGTGV